MKDQVQPTYAEAKSFANLRAYITIWEQYEVFLKPFKKSHNTIIYYQQRFCCTEMQKYLEKTCKQVIFGACTALLTLAQLTLSKILWYFISVLCMN